jgi:hypothetical protein
LIWTRHRWMMLTWQTVVVTICTAPFSASNELRYWCIGSLKKLWIFFSFNFFGFFFSPFFYYAEKIKMKMKFMIADRLWDYGNIILISVRVCLLFCFDVWKKGYIIIHHNFIFYVFVLKFLRIMRKKN